MHSTLPLLNLLPRLSKIIREKRWKLCPFSLLTSAQSLLICALSWPTFRKRVAGVLLILVRSTIEGVAAECLFEELEQSARPL
jgi:hypothetical protein